MIVTAHPEPEPRPRPGRRPAARSARSTAPTRAHLHPGGKGINVSRVLVRHGVPTLAVLPTGGADGARLVEMLGRASTCRPAGARSSSQSAATSRSSRRRGRPPRSTRPGRRSPPDEVDALLAAARDAAGERSPVRWSCAGQPAARRRRRLLRPGRRTRRPVRVPFALDTSGRAADRGRRGRRARRWSSPTTRSSRELVGRELTTVGDVVDAAREVIAAGTRAVARQPRRARRPARHCRRRRGGPAVRRSCRCPPSARATSPSPASSLARRRLDAARPPAHRGRLRPRGSPAARHRRPRPAPTSTWTPSGSSRTPTPTSPLKEL